VKLQAAAIIRERLDALLRPASAVTPSQWAAANLIVPDGPRANEKWDPRLTPYIVEPLDNMGADAPINKEVIRKSAQTGFTMMAIAAAGSWIDTDPAGGILLVQPTDGALSDFIADKLNPAIENSPALKAKVKPQVSRSGEGSTTYLRRYPGGSMALAIANSTADLRSKTKRKVIKDEASEYPADLDGQGSPHAMIEARYESFRASGDWKELNISTPTIVGACYIDEEFKKGDQRYWNVTCPGCSGKFPFRFGANFKHNDEFPFSAHYVAPCCGTIIESHQKNALVLDGEWIASQPGPGKFRSYHFDAMSSPFVPWDLIAERWVAAQKNPADLKAFYNLTLGEAYEIKGDAPDWKRLMERREDYPRGRIPPRGLMLTAAADVQMRGIYVEVVAWAPNRESWVVHTEVIEGDTTDANAGAFLRLAEIYAIDWPTAFGDRRRVDAFGVDTGFRSHVVYNWCRTRHNAYALDGRDGWNRPALGTPSLVDVDLNGEKIGTTRIWPVGTWPLKGHWYEDLRREGRKAGHESDPAGYCHFHNQLDEVYFRQITSEYLAEKKTAGRTQTKADARKTKTWEVRGTEENHFLDCRIYNMALADHLGLSTMTSDEWKMLARDRAPGMAQADLFAPLTIKIQTAASLASAVLQSDVPAPAGVVPTAEIAPAAAPDVPAPPARSQSEPHGSGWIGRDVSGWLNR
jgi:phage terminase large subunit GpA-like protein